MAETIRTIHQGQAGKAAAASAMSDHLDTRTAATEVAHLLHDRLAGSAVDLLALFGSFHHRAGLGVGADLIRDAVSAGCVLGATAESVLGDDEEREGRAGLCALALRLPGAAIRSFHIAPGEQDLPLADQDAMRARIAWREDTRAAIVVADPFTTPPQMLDTIASCGRGRPIPICGGFASGASQPGQNALIHDGSVDAHGLTGITISGDVEIDFVVSQGCRPIGPPMIVTRSADNMIHELGGRNVLEVIHELAEELSERERELLSKGLLIGVVIDEYKERFGRSDFLIRNVIGIDRTHQAIAVNDFVRRGQTVQLHVRDATTADEDLHLLLDAQQLKSRPVGVLLFTCNGRGTRLFEQPNHDVEALRSRLGAVPLAGFFAAGEIGPIGERSYLHGHTASAALFRTAGNQS